MKVELRVSQFVVEGGACGRGWNVRGCSFLQLILDIVHRCTSSWIDGVRIHIHKSKLNAGRRNVSGDREDGGHWAEGRQGHIEVPDRLLF